MYAAPTISIGVLILGIKPDSALQKNVHSSITTANPVSMLRLNGKARLKPSRPAFDMLIRLFGPGVTAVATAYDKKFIQLNMLTSKWFGAIMD